MSLHQRFSHNRLYFTEYLRRMIEHANEEPIVASSNTRPFDEWVIDNGPISDFRHLLFSSLVIQLYSFTEHCLQKIADDLKAQKELNLSINEIKGNDAIHRFRKYFVSHAHLDIKEADPHYNSVQELRKVRNCLVHHIGKIPEKDLSAMKAIKGVTISTGFIDIEESFITRVSEDVFSFIEITLENY